MKIDGTGLAGDIYDAIPANLSGNASRYILSSAREGIRSEKVRKLIPDMLSSYTVNIAYHANNPDVGMSLEKDAGRYKLFNSDICPLEVKSGNYRTHKLLDAFCNKFSNRIGGKYVVHTKDYKWENGIYYIPMYMVPFL